MQRTGQTLPCQAPSRPSYIPGHPSLNRRCNTNRPREKSGELKLETLKIIAETPHEVEELRNVLIQVSWSESEHSSVGAVGQDG